MRDGSGKWLPSYWQELLSSTVQAISSVSDSQSVWNFGGGTSLAIDLDHRISYDIAAFVDSAALIKKLVPHANPVTKALCWNDLTQRADFDWPGSCLKLNIKGKGEIDFLSASEMVEDPTSPFDFDGTIIRRERPAEIIAKKLRYRSSRFKHRDAFDLAAVFLKSPEELQIAAECPFLPPEVYKRAALRIALKNETFQKEIVEEVNPTAFGASFIERAAEIALEAISFMEEKSSLENTQSPEP